MTLAYHVVRPGDQLYQVLRAHYGDAAFFADQDGLVGQVQSVNPQITDINMIFPNQVIALPSVGPADPIADVPQSVLVHSGEMCRAISGSAPETFDAVKLMEQVGLGGATMMGSYFSEGQKALKAGLGNVQQVESFYQKYKAGEMTKGQYDYARRKMLDATDQRMGIFKGRSIGPAPARELFRIKPRSADPFINYKTNITKLNTGMAKVKVGGGLLTIAQAGYTVQQIHTADDNRKRTGLVLETVGSAAGGMAAGALAVLVIGTPVGWTALLVVGAVSVIGGAGGAVLANKLEKATLTDENGQRIYSPIDEMWEPIYGGPGPR